MIDIFCTGGQLLGVMIPYDRMQVMVMDAHIASEEFIQYKFQNGMRGSVRKDTIIAFTESFTNEEEEYK